MSRDPTTGAYTAPANAVNPAVTRTKISSSAFNTLRDDLQSALNDAALIVPQTNTADQRQQARENIAAVGYDAQTLADADQTQALTNLAAGDVTWTGSHTFNGSMAGTIDGTVLTWPFGGAGLGGSFRLQQSAAIPDAYPLLDIIRTSTGTGGTAGAFVPSIRAQAYRPAGRTDFGVAILGSMDSSNTSADNSEDAAFYMRAIKRGDGKVFAGGIELTDYTADPTRGSVSVEIDQYVNGTDTNLARSAVDVFVRPYPGLGWPTMAVTGYGLRFSSGTGATTGTYRRAIAFNDATFEKLLYVTGSAVVQDGIDFSTITFSGNVFRSTGFTIGPTGALAATTGTFSSNVGVTGTIAGTGFVQAGSGAAATAFLYASGNNNGTRPTSNTGGAIGYNFTGGAGAIDFWNTFIGGASTSFTWKQKTGASTHDDIMSLSPAGVLTLASALPISSGGTGTTAGAAVRVVQQVFTTSGTYTPTTGLLYAVIEGIGCGAGGGGVAGSASQGGSAGSGGAGGYSRLIASAATIGASQAVTIGSAGAGGAAGNNAGSAGGDVSVGVLMVAKGGSPGGGGAASAPGTPGAGGVAGTGSFTPTGASGMPGNGAASVTVGTTGASSLFGGGGIGTRATNGATAGGNATNYGAGGGGAAFHNTTNTAAGGNGAAGVVIVTEYVNQ